MLCQLFKGKKVLSFDKPEATGTGAETAGTTCTCSPRARRCISSRPWSCCTTWRSSCRGITPATMTTWSGESPRLWLTPHLRSTVSREGSVRGSREKQRELSKRGRGRALLHALCCRPVPWLSENLFSFCLPDTRSPPAISPKPTALTNPWLEAFLRHLVPTTSNWVFIF